MFADIEIAKDLGPWGYLLATVLVTVVTSFIAACGWIGKKIHEGVIWAGKMGERIAEGHLNFIDSMSAEQTKQTSLLKDLKDVAVESNEKISKWGTSTFQEQIADRVYTKMKAELEERGCKLSDSEVRILVDTHRKRKATNNDKDA